MIKRTVSHKDISHVPILEVAIGNEIRDENTGKFDFKSGEIISLAYFYGNVITVLQKEKTDSETEWKKILTKELLTMPICYSNYSLKEKDAIMGYLGLNRFVENISLVKGKGINKDSLFNYLNKLGIVDSFPFDPFSGDTLKIVENYKLENYDSIIEHLISSLVKQHYVFKNRFLIQDNLKDKIKDGWYQGEFK